MNIHIKGVKKGFQEPHVGSCQEPMTNELAVNFQKNF